MSQAGIISAPKRTRIRDSAKTERLRRIGAPERLIGPAGTRTDLKYR